MSWLPCSVVDMVFLVFSSSMKSPRASSPETAAAVRNLLSEMGMQTPRLEFVENFPRPQDVSPYVPLFTDSPLDITDTFVEQAKQEGQKTDKEVAAELPDSPPPDPDYFETDEETGLAPVDQGSGLAEAAARSIARRGKERRKARKEAQKKKKVTVPKFPVGRGRGKGGWKKGRGIRTRGGRGAPVGTRTPAATPTKPPPSAALGRDPSAEPPPAEGQSIAEILEGIERPAALLSSEEEVLVPIDTTAAEQDLARFHEAIGIAPGEPLRPAAEPDAPTPEVERHLKRLARRMTGQETLDEQRERSPEAFQYDSAGDPEAEPTRPPSPKRKKKTVHFPRSRGVQYDPEEEVDPDVLPDVATAPRTSDTSTRDRVRKNIEKTRQRRAAEVTEGSAEVHPTPGPSRKRPPLQRSAKTQVILPNPTAAALQRDAERNVAKQWANLVKTKKWAREIQQMRNKTTNLIPRAPFTRLVREIDQELEFESHRWTPGAIGALQEAAEMYLTEVMEDTNLLARHAKRVTIQEKDMKLAIRIREGDK